MLLNIGRILFPKVPPARQLPFKASTPVFEREKWALSFVCGEVYLI